MDEGVTIEEEQNNHLRPSAQIQASNNFTHKQTHE